MIPLRVIKELVLGDEYVIWWNYKHKMNCKLIQPTKYGFNFLNLDTNKCVLPHHLYRSKWDKYKNGNWFFVHGNLKIEKKV